MERQDMRAKTDRYTILPYARWKTNKQQKYKHAHKAPNIFLVIISVIHLEFTAIGYHRRPERTGYNVVE